MFFDDNTYKKIYPKGCNSGFIYGLPKSHKFLSTTFDDHFFHLIVSSIATCNSNLASFLGASQSSYTKRTLS